MFERIKRFFSGRDEPAPEAVAPTLFTATRLPTAPPASNTDEPLFTSAPAAPPREPDLWDDDPLVSATDVEDVPDDVPLEDGPDDVSLEDLTDELSRIAADDYGDDDADEPATVDGAPAPGPEHGPEPEPLFAGLERARGVEPENSNVSVHGERLDSRPGPIRMTPSEALALAKEGPGVLRHRRPGR